MEPCINKDFTLVIKTIKSVVKVGTDVINEVRIAITSIVSST